ncbi:MAG: hypothetical protein M3178_18560 [Pseudomonadota bacterium]|nr:hypothetical protein [Pseudomonadota bacterium]
MNEAWDRIRALVTRGNAAGAVASLTLLGSQQLVGRNPRLNVFWALVIFAVGLLALLVREFLIVWHVHYQRKGKVTQAVDEWDAFNPPPFIMKFARSFDYVSTISMVVGGVWGLYVLYGLTRLECK